ncbi:TIGR04222 domain-containing membrane protein [Streptomyces sp. NPDC052610]|uniref:TIGR04222 domain-containing membrane protein n=1 Tax=Streptomyces sp. NPDC052610 TaxID=3154952 RepID=UPI003429ECF1
MSDGTAGLEPHEIALLRGGPRAAVTVALVALHLRGVVEPGRPGTVRAVPWDAAVSRLSSPWEDVVHSELEKPLRPRRLTRRPYVRLGVSLIRVRLAEEGLLRWPFLGPTRAARRDLAALRERHPLPARRQGLTDHDKLLAVALHGEAALRVLVPRFAYRTGLLPGAGVADPGSPGSSWGYGGGAHGCGGGCGGGSD